MVISILLCQIKNKEETNRKIDECKKWTDRLNGIFQQQNKETKN